MTGVQTCALPILTFIPVLFQISPGKPVHERDIAFWTNDSIYKYPYFLINAHHHAKRCKASDVDKFLPESVIFGDSGGLQAVTLGVGKPYIKVLTKWQEEHCHIGFGFDELPFKTDKRKLTGWEFDAVNFDKYAERSLENLEIALATRTNTNFKLYGIIQGRNFDEYKRWYDIIKKADVDGYCVKSPSNNPVNVAETALFAYYNLDKPVHFLGMANYSKTSIIYYFSKYYKHKITFDSSSYQQGCQFRTYIHPTSPSLKIRYVKDGTEVADYEDIIIFDKVHDLSFCGCAACSFLTKDEVKKMHEDNDPMFGNVLMLHNGISMFKMFTFMEQICHNKAAMTNTMRCLFKEATATRVASAYEIIDEGITKGYEYVSAKYQALLSENVEVAKQTSVFDF